MYQNRKIVLKEGRIGLFWLISTGDSEYVAGFVCVFQVGIVK